MSSQPAQLVAYQARHFKPFVDTGWVEIKPITLMFGHNSSGKSALLSILPMLQQTIVDPNLGTPFVFATDAGVDLGTFDEVAHRHQVSLDEPVWFNVELSISQAIPQGYKAMVTARLLKALKALGSKAEGVRVEVAANYNKKRRRTAITDFRLLASDETLLFRCYRKTTAANQRWHFEPEPPEDLVYDISWHHFIPRLIGAARTAYSRSLSELISSVDFLLSEQLRQLVHIGPSRAIPRRAYRLTGASPRDVGSGGENWLSILLQSSVRAQLARQVNQWLDRLGYTLRIEWGKQGYVHPMLRDQGSLEVSLQDVGFGISQVLPVLVQGFSSPPGTILILEQPEIHLHPAAQAELGDMLLAISQRGVRLLVETHSEHLLLRLRRRIAESRLNPLGKSVLDPHDVVIYFIEQLGVQSHVYQVLPNELGAFIDPPERFRSFFSDDYEETIEWSRVAAQIAQEAGSERGG